MDSSSPMGNLIGFDAATLGTPGAINRGRRSTDHVDGSSFAEVYDLAAYRTTGSREAARVADPSPLQRVPTPTGLTVASSASAAPIASGQLAPLDRIAADRLYVHLTTGGSWMRVADEGSGTVVMRLHDAEGAAVREVRVTELSAATDGPEVA
ncbi:MAG: hypothetical protein Q7T55_08580 [Solirubrobacteraceae bacterium]|nr:hypothetical protein [Solirubrobacteraceae bacterium]